MSKFKEDIINWLDQSATKIEQNLSNREIETKEFRKTFTKVQLIEALADPENDIEDVNALKAMLVIFYNHKIESVLN